MKLEVLFAPLVGVAIVTSADSETPLIYWAVSPKWGVRDERAPQMFNTHLDPKGEFVEMEDEHPFPKVLEELNKRIGDLTDFTK